MPEQSGNKRCIQWSMWANEMALYGAFTVAVGGIVGVIGGAVEQFEFWIPFGVYGIVFGILVSVLEYPRGKKNKGNTIQRSRQQGFTKLNYKLYKVTRSYVIRAIALFLICLPAGVIVPTFFGAFCLLAASVVYLVAAIRGEEWVPIGIELPGERRPHFDTISSPPTKPPPRLPQQV